MRFNLGNKFRSHERNAGETGRLLLLHPFVLEFFSRVSRISRLTPLRICIPLKSVSLPLPYVANLFAVVRIKGEFFVMTRNQSFKFVALSAAALFLGAAMSGCGNGNSIGPGANSLSRVRLVSALLNCNSNVDFTQTGTTLPISPSGGLAYRDVTSTPTSPYSSVRAGIGINYSVFPTGTTTGAIATANVTLSPHDDSSTNSDGTYTLIATGICGTGTGFNAPNLIRLIDSYPTTFTGPTANTAAIRVVNLSPDAGNISLFSNGALLNGTDALGVSNVPYAVGTGFTGSHYDGGIVTNSPLNLTIRNSANGILTTATNTSAVSLTSNHAYTLFVFGQVTPGATGKPLDVKLVQDF